MSVPARRLPAPQPDEPPSTRRAARSGRDHLARPTARPTPPPPPQGRARREVRHRSHPAFWAFSAVLLAGLIMAAVSLNALVVNATYRLRSVQQEQQALVDRGAALRIEVARLSSPSRIADWAARNQMRLPASDEVVALRVPGVAQRSAG